MLTKSQNGFDRHFDDMDTFVGAVQIGGYRLGIFKNFVGFPDGFNLQKFHEAMVPVSGEKSSLRTYIDRVMALHESEFNDHGSKSEK